MRLYLFLFLVTSTGFAGNKGSVPFHKANVEDAIRSVAAHAAGQNKGNIHFFIVHVMLDTDFTGHPREASRAKDVLYAFLDSDQDYLGLWAAVALSRLGADDERFRTILLDGLMTEIKECYNQNSLEYKATQWFKLIENSQNLTPEEFSRLLSLWSLFKGDRPFMAFVASVAAIENAKPHLALVMRQSEHVKNIALRMRKIETKYKTKFEHQSKGRGKALYRHAAAVAKLCLHWASLESAEAEFLRVVANEGADPAALSKAILELNAQMPATLEQVETKQFLLDALQREDLSLPAQAALRNILKVTVLEPAVNQWESILNNGTPREILSCFAALLQPARAD